MPKDLEQLNTWTKHFGNKINPQIPKKKSTPHFNASKRGKHGKHGKHGKKGKHGHHGHKKHKKLSFKEIQKKKAELMHYNRISWLLHNYTKKGPYKTENCQRIGAMLRTCEKAVL